jgi:predicted phosphodiesterase
MLIGIIADTHGYIDPRLADAFAGVDTIIAAGDIGSTDVLDALRKIPWHHPARGEAPTTDNRRRRANTLNNRPQPPSTNAQPLLYAVRGNNDDKIGGLGLPLRADFTLAGVRFHLVHQLPDAKPQRTTQVVVFGHSHRALIDDRGGVLYVNPGAAGRAGFHRIQTVALIRAAGGAVHEARIIELGPRLPRPH